MKGSLPFALATLVALLPAAGLAQVPAEPDASARQTPRGPDQASQLMTQLQLLRMPPVQQELQLNAQQLQQVENLYSQVGWALLRGSRSAELQVLQGREREQRRAEIQQAHQEYLDSKQSELHQQLAPAQRERLAQLQLQYRGPAALLDPPVARQLQLTAQQYERITQLARQAQDREDSLGRAATAAQRQQRATQAQQIRDQLQGEILGVLTPHQRQSWEQLLGRPFFRQAAASRDAPARPGAAEQQEFRTWTDNSGRFTVEATLVEQTPEHVRLKNRAGKTVQVPITRLSPQDRHYLANLEAKPDSQ